MCFSAMTQSGVTTISVSQVNTAQQAFLFLLFIVGHIVSYPAIQKIASKVRKRSLMSFTVDSQPRHPVMSIVSLS